MDRIKELFRFIYRVFSNIIHLLMSAFYHRDNRIVLFGSWMGERFADNPRFLFQYLSKNKQRLGLTHVVWVTRDETLKKELSQNGYEVYMIGSKESAKYHKKAGMHVLCNVLEGNFADIDVKWSYGATRINLWHGVGVVKGAIQDSLEYKQKKRMHPLIYTLREKMGRIKLFKLIGGAEGGWGYSYFLSPTPADTLQFQRFKYIPSKLFIQAAYPRTCQCEKLLGNEKKLLQFMGRYKYVVLYLPTFRQDFTEDDCVNLSEQVYDILMEHNVLWIQKAHSVSKTVYNSSNLDHNIINLDPKFDINTIMPAIDLLVTDYSSAASDARYFRKNIIFYFPDIKEYKKGKNGFSVEARELLYGPKYFTVKEFREGLLQELEGDREYIDDEYERIRQKYWGDTMNYEQIWRHICMKTGYKTL